MELHTLGVDGGSRRGCSGGGAVLHGLTIFAPRGVRSGRDVE